MIPARKRSKKDDKKSGPLAKIRMFDSSKPKNKICFICDLPDDILQLIISFIPYWHLPRLRKSCKRLLHACDSVLLHDFEVSIHHFKMQNPQGSEYATLMAIKEVTWPYVAYGLGSIFCGTILPFIWQRNDGFVPHSEKIKSFLKHFYSLANDKCGKINSKKSRMLYCITFMRLLKKFKHSRLIASTFCLPNYLQIVFEIRGPWISILATKKPVSQSQDRFKLLMILCELMIANSTNRALKKIWKSESDVFIFGNDASEKAEFSKHPSTRLTFKIYAPKRIGALLQSCLEEDVVELPMPLPKGEFLVEIDVHCRETNKWGSFQVHHIEIGPQQLDTNFDYNSDEGDENC